MPLSENYGFLTYTDIEWCSNLTFRMNTTNCIFSESWWYTKYVGVYCTPIQHSMWLPWQRLKQVIKFINFLFLFHWIFSRPMTSECNCCRFIRREILKATFWYLNDFYWTFLWKVIIEKLKIHTHKLNRKTTKWPSWWNFSGHIGIIETCNSEFFNLKYWFKSLFVFQILKK